MRHFLHMTLTLVFSTAFAADCDCGKIFYLLKTNQGNKQGTTFPPRHRCALDVSPIGTDGFTFAFQPDLDANMAVQAVAYPSTDTTQWQLDEVNNVLSVRLYKGADNTGFAYIAYDKTTSKFVSARLDRSMGTCEF